MRGETMVSNVGLLAMLLLSPNEDGNAELSAGESNKSSVGSDIIGVSEERLSGRSDGDLA